MHEHQLRILFVGDAQREEFQLVWERLSEYFQTAAALKMDIQEVLADFPEADGNAESAEMTAPDVILFLQSFPGEFLQEEVELLRRRFPLAPVAVIYGSWCEGEQRTGKPVTDVPRFHWAQWVMGGPRELEAFFRGELSVFSLPVTLSLEERFLWRDTLEKTRNDAAPERFLHEEAAEFCRNKKEPLSVFVYSPEVEQADVLMNLFRKDETLRHMLKCTHFADFHDAALTPPDFVLADFVEFNAESRDAFLALKRRYPHAVFYVFCEFPRIAHWRWLEQHGVRNIFSKPFPVTDFLVNFLPELRVKILSPFLIPHS